MMYSASQRAKSVVYIARPRVGTRNKINKPEFLFLNEKNKSDFALGEATSVIFLSLV